MTDSMKKGLRVTQGPCVIKRLRVTKGLCVIKGLHVIEGLCVTDSVTKGIAYK